MKASSQLTSFFTSAAILASLAAVSSVRAKEVGVLLVFDSLEDLVPPARVSRLRLP